MNSAIEYQNIIQSAKPKINSTKCYDFNIINQSPENFNQFLFRASSGALCRTSVLFVQNQVDLAKGSIANGPLQLVFILGRGMRCSVGTPKRCRKLCFRNGRDRWCLCVYSKKYVYYIYMYIYIYIIHIIYIYTFPSYVQVSKCSLYFEVAIIQITLR